MKSPSSSPRRRRRRDSEVSLLTSDIWVHFVIGYLNPVEMLRLGQVARAFVAISLTPEYWSELPDNDGPGDPRTWYWSRRRVVNSLRDLRQAVDRIGQTKATSLIELRAKYKSQPFTMAVLSMNGKILTHSAGSKILKVSGSVSVKEGLLPKLKPADSDDFVYQPHRSYIYKKEDVIAVACEDRTIKLIDSRTVAKKSYTVIQTIKAKPKQGHTGQITSLGMDSRAVYTASFDKTARVWSRRTGQQLFHVRHPDVVTALKVQQDGDGGMFCTHSIGAHSKGLSVIKLHDASAGKTIIDDLKVASIAAAAASGGPGLHGMQQAYLCGLTDNATILWTAMKHAVVPFDLRTGNHIGVVPTGIGAVSAFHMPDNSNSSGGMVYVGGSESIPSLVGCDTRMMKKVFHIDSAHDKVITSLASDTFNGVPHLFSASRDGTARIWDTSTGTMVSCLFKHTNLGGIHDIKWNGLHLLAVRNQSVQVLDFTRHASPFYKLVVA
eukprot:TRINITY_DN14357_c0_g1_i1.p1 TRINITY_DN14357_c0_g1~~TRINITY_DN14357_c0_g1_i1.p1  ORF type:complete len:494 (+),score=81.34 TRINITY_DN14357_c0_g1_i1:37-1518(+)